MEKVQGQRERMMTRMKTRTTFRKSRTRVKVNTTITMKGTRITDQLPKLKSRNVWPDVITIPKENPTYQIGLNRVNESSSVVLLLYGWHWHQSKKKQVRVET